MNKEIKEILDKWKCYIGLTKKFTTNEYEMLRVEDIDKILDYITNLQEENERLHNLIVQHIDKEDNLIDYKQRNEKAIEYIEKGNKHFKENYNEPYEYAFMVNADELMKILQGKSDE